MAHLQEDIQRKQIRLFVENVQTDDPTVQYMTQLDHLSQALRAK